MHVQQRGLRRFSHTIGAWGAAAVLTLAVTACGGDDTEAAYCNAWSDTVDAWVAFREVDVISGGLDSLRATAEDLRDAVERLDEASRAQIGPSVADFRAAVDELVTTVTSPDLPVDRRDDVRAAADEVAAAWDDVVGAARADCPDIAVPAT